MAENRPTVGIVLRLDPQHLKAIDESLPAGVRRSAWIRGAILQRLGRLELTEADREPHA